MSTSAKDSTTLPKVDEKWQIAPLKSLRHGWLGQVPGKSKLDLATNPTFLPNLGSMQRASTPWQYNTPIRAVEVAKDAEGSKAGALKSLTVLRPPLPGNYVRRIRRKVQQLSVNSSGNVKSYIKDLMFLADSASRAGHIYSAAQAYHKMGVAHDNIKNHQAANNNYQQCLALCVASRNQQGEALAYNCLGINHYKMGNYEQAIRCHNRHLELADPNGRLLAHTNLGVVFEEMQLYDHAAIHHQHAIEYANRINSRDAQSVAVGNLGIAALKQGDSETSKACLQYHLRMCDGTSHLKNKFSSLARAAANNEAHHRLGESSINQGNLEEAATHFALSVDLARRCKDQSMEEKSSVMLGVSQGLMHFDDHRKALFQENQSVAIPEIDEHAESRNSKL